MKNRINKWIDLVDRAAWTAIQTSLGVVGATAITTGEVDWKLVGISAGIASAGAVAKVMAAQNIGDSGLGDAVPGHSVVEPPK